MQASFLKSARDPFQFPTDSGREVAVAGRSNSGKSSAINALAGRRSLARTSKTPGRTRLINFFAVGENQRLTDLPGYGYAKVPDSVLRHWRGLLETYFRQRRSLVGLLITVDVRRDLNDLDRVMLNWAQNARIPVTVLLTKADKLRRGAAMNRRSKIADALPPSVPAVLFSARTKQGIEEARGRLVGWLQPDPGWCPVPRGAETGEASGRR